MKNLLIALTVLSSTAAMADGFKCNQPDYDINLSVYNKTDAEAGVRNAAQMIVSDNNVSHGRKTIAVFSANKRTLGQNGASYMAVVDLRVSESNRSGENVLGTKLGLVDKIFVDVDFNYNYPMSNGEETEGTVTVVKRNGQEYTLELNCTRYIKN